MKNKKDFQNERAETLRNEFRKQNRNDNFSSFQPKSKGPAPSYARAPTPSNKSEYNSQKFIAKSAYSEGSMMQRGRKPPACTKCGRNHPGTCSKGSTDCFKCSQNGHFM